MTLKYTFEEMGDGDFQVRLCGEFVCYSNKMDEREVDDVLKYKGFETRVDFLSSRLSQYK